MIAQAANKPEPSVETPAKITIQTNAAFNEWVGRLANMQRYSVGALIEMALNHYADAVGFDEDAPARLKRDRRCND